MRSRRIPRRHANRARIATAAALALTLALAAHAGGPCTLEGGPGCQLPDQAGHGIGAIAAVPSDANPRVRAAAADDFTPLDDGTVTEVCWWGAYVDPTAGADCGPGPGDAFRVTYYRGLIPGLVHAGPFLVSPAKAATGLTIPSPFGPLAEYGFAASHPPVAVEAGRCYWIEVVNATTGSCSWRWSAAPPGDALAFLDDGLDGYDLADHLDLDLAWCVDVATGDAGAACPVRPVNDDCAEALPIACGTSILVDNTLASTSPADPPFSCRFGGADRGAGTMWYRFTAAAETALLETCPSDAPADDSLVAVYAVGNTGDPCGTLTELACSEDSDDCGFGSLLSRVCVEGLTVGEEYYVQVAAWSDDDRGVYTLSLECPCPDLTGACCLPVVGCVDGVERSDCTAMGGAFAGAGTDCVSEPCPDHDDCDRAIPLDVPSATIGTTVGALPDPTPPFCGTSISASGVWYVVTGTGNTITVTTCSPLTNYDTKLNVYCGCCDPLECVGGNDDDSGLLPDCDLDGRNLKSTVTWCSAAGQDYLVLVQGAGGMTGDFELTVTDDGVPCSEPAPCAKPTLALEIDTCPGDALPGEAGAQVVVELWLRDACTSVTGFQAFLEFDEGALVYRGDLSVYTAEPFPLHIQDIDTAEVESGELRLDGSEELGGGGTDADSLLATLVFDFSAACETTSVDFDLGQGFDSELSFEGDPISTRLRATGVFVLDAVPPVIDPCPDDVSVLADAALGCDGAVVEFTAPGATDDCGGDAIVTCAPPSGAVFPTGTTEVVCTARDDCGNLATCTFEVTVAPLNPIELTVELPGSVPTTRCIRLVTDDCATFADALMVFADHDGNPATPVRATATVNVPCGDWSQLCAKDRAHTQWHTRPLLVSGDGRSYVADGVFGLEPGDNDDDGDVDINDVSLLIAQFGGPEPAGGCPWSGARGADFNNNGNVGSEDYSLMSAWWLEATDCPCTPGPADAAAGRRTTMDASRLDPRLAARVDLDGNGVVDVRDVERFERRHGLPDTLSTAMRKTLR